MLAAFPYALTFKVSLKFLCFICVEKLISSKFGDHLSPQKFQQERTFFFFFFILKYPEVSL